MVYWFMDICVVYEEIKQKIKKSLSLIGFSKKKSCFTRKNKKSQNKALIIFYTGTCRKRGLCV